jgi:hypothetical protein
MGRRLERGANDLLTLYSELSKEAYQWSPADYSFGSHKSMKWICSNGHIWEAKIYNRTIGGRGCPYCSGRVCITGVNDLATLYPAIAAEAHGWDPKKYSAYSGQRVQWKCDKGHYWKTKVGKRTRNQTGCPYCAGKLPIVGETDLASVFPDIAKEACGWDPSTVTPGSGKKLKWKCEQGHEWMCRVANRTIQGTKCTVCSRKVLVPGVNDLLSKFPEVARDAYGWDPATVRYGSDKKMRWLCPSGHVYITSPNHRTNPSNATSCPQCAACGYKKTLPGWIYLMQRSGEQQIGITNVPKQRLRTHASNRWELIEIIGPYEGFRAWQIESLVKKWLRRSNLLIQGTHENWRTEALLISSLNEIFFLSGVDSLLLQG